MKSIRLISTFCFVLSTITATPLASALELFAVESREFYVGLDASYSDVDLAGENANPYMLTSKAGFTLKPQVLLELQHSVGVTDDSLLRHDVEIDSASGIYLRLVSAPLNDVTADLMLGYASSKVTLSGASDSSETYKDGSYGIGFTQRYPTLPHLSLRMEYKVLYNEDNLRLSAFNFGINYLF